MKRNPYIAVLIAGSSNGGKTSASQTLVKEFPNSIVIKQDDYFFDPEHKNHQWIKLQSGVSHQQWELYSSIDWSKFDKKLNELHNQLIKESSLKKIGNNLESVKKNVKLILIEGHVLLNHKMPTFFHVDKRVFLTLSKETSKKRRQTRTYDPPDPFGYFDEYVWPSYLEHLEYAEQNYSDVIFLSGELDREIIFNRIKKEIDDVYSSFI